MLIIAISAAANTNVGMDLRKSVLPSQVFGNAALYSTQFAC